ncbi:DNA-processing protein DprA [Romboutsia sp.]|uniref:DNA-processing protein DprA n=1 Tax=Romboutsia sp. TaxID=1965302 RepID=UPI002C37C57E|nr:DNA-processing protein DprA [Romboutsia sp.]HSQ90287.1 DNA-processing protein DprA [Romboutsia sp.]
MEKRDAYLWLNSINGISNKTIDIIKNNIINIEELIKLSDREIHSLKNINSNIKENIVKYKSLAYLDSIKEKLNKEKINYICIEEKGYPNNLKYIHDAPNILFYKGDISIVNKNIGLAVVGSRKATRYGINCATSISKNLSNLGINIISGLAIGIDSYAHIGCMEGYGKTIAVLGSCVHNILPKKNIYLANKILENGGLIISDYNINSKVFPSNYANRNRIISGISEGIIVVEAAKKSGALITVEFGLEQGKNIFAVPGNINSCMSEGCHKIIKEGAKLINNIEDILNEYKIINIECKENLKKYDNINLSQESIQIIHTIKKQGVLHIDEICDNTRMEIKSVNTILSELVLKDVLVEMNNKTYSLNV